MSVEERYPSLYDRHSSLFRRNMESLGRRDIVIASIGGAGQSYVGNVLQELGLNYVDPYTEALNASAAPEHLSWRRRLAATRRRDESGAPQRKWPRFVKSEELPEATLLRQVRGICLLVRDPRDALYSRYRFRRDFARDPWALRRGSFASWLKTPYPGGELPATEWAGFYRQWLDTGYLRVRIARFEDLKTAAHPWRALFRFAGVEVAETQLRQALDRSRFDVMRAHEDNQSDAGTDARILRRGAVDEWREWLTPELRRQFSGAELAAVARELGYALDNE